MDKVQTPSHSECYKTSPERYIFYFYINCLIYASKTFRDRALLYNEKRSDFIEISFNICFLFFIFRYILKDRLCGLVVRVLDYRCRGPGFDPRALQKQKKSSGSGTGSTQPRKYN
jgi:hypothetical protein